MSFGHPDAFSTAGFDRLPRQMQSEGVLLLMEMGFGAAAIAQRLGLQLSEVGRLANPGVPFSLADKWFEQIGNVA